MIFNKIIIDKSTKSESFIADSENTEFEQKPVILKKVPLKKKKPVKFIEEDEDSSSEKSYEEEDVVKKILHESLDKLKYEYAPKWWDNIKFYLKDATKFKTYSNEKVIHYTHIYSYNKLMNFECRK